VLHLFLLFTLLIFPTSMGKLKYLPIYKTTAIKQNKNLPPHIAFLETNFDAKKSEWLELTKRNLPVVKVGAELQRPAGPYIVAQKRVLAGIIIRKNTEILEPVKQAFYKTSEQRFEENQGPQWLQAMVREPAALSSKEQKTLSLASGPLPSSGRRISGPIEITGGLAVTNDHHIEVRRTSDGVFQEMGKVDLLKGVYSIDVDEASGTIVARLVDRSGETLGEGSVRISQLQTAQGKFIPGPRLELAPSISWGGRVSSYYPTRGKKTELPGVTSYGGENKINVSSNGDISFESLVKNSSTIVRAEAKDHWRTNKLLVAGEHNFAVTLFPDSMISALKSIVTEKPPLPDEMKESAIVWGVAKIDGKPLSGVTVTAESDPEAKAIYFNEFMIPDPKLKETTANGLYAFTDIEEGFQALLAQRGDAYFGHQNVSVEKGFVAVGDISSSLKTEPVTLKAFDAFSGESANLIADLQSLQAPTAITGGSASVILTQVPRMSLLYTEDTAPYLKANYFYNDTDTYIHLPMIRDEWLVGIRSEEKINQIDKSGTIVGFVPGESFEVYLAGKSKGTTSSIAYFDATGKKTNRGTAGGGFIIFNTPLGLQEVVVVSDKVEKIISKVVPVDESSLSILNFNSY
jgi:hypothetical protein